MVNRAELAAFLRTRRARLSPGEAGLPGGQRRRTPRLRRQEVAELAGLSVDYYIRLEQGRGPRPSRQVLTALARALLLSTDEREYLFRIPGEAPWPTPGPTRDVPAGIRHLLDLMPETPAYVVSARYDILAWNRLAAFRRLAALPLPAPSGAWPSDDVQTAPVGPGQRSTGPNGDAQPLLPL